MGTTINHSERAHALLSASSAHRWLNCTPSARLGEQFKDTTSEYAKEGTLAHEIAELMVSKYLTSMGTRTYNSKLKKFKAQELYKDEMLTHAETYLDYIKEVSMAYPTAPYTVVEARFGYGEYAKDGFGTVDCLMIAGDTLHIIDYKYGKGVSVSAEDNSQLKIYALGAYLKYNFLYNIKNVKLTIIQPRLDNISIFELSIEDLLSWGESIKPIAEKAFNGEGDYVAGDHCRFCPAKAQCRAKLNEFSAVLDFGLKKPPLITLEEVAWVYSKAKEVEDYIKSIKAFALTEALKGNEVPGYKVVEGRGGRDYVDVDVAFEHLKSNGVDEAMLYERKPLTAPAVEKLLGKKQYVALLEEPGHVVKRPGAPTLDVITSKKPVYNPTPSAIDDFKITKEDN